MSKTEDHDSFAKGWLKRSQPLIQQASWKILARLDKLDSQAAEKVATELVTQLCGSLLDRCEELSEYCDEQRVTIDQLRAKVSKLVGKVNHVKAPVGEA